MVAHLLFNLSAALKWSSFQRNWRCPAWQHKAMVLLFPARAQYRSFSWTGPEDSGCLCLEGLLLQWKCKLRFGSQRCLDPLWNTLSISQCTSIVEIESRELGIWSLMSPLRKKKFTLGKESSWVTWNYLQREFEGTSATASGKTFPLAVDKHHRYKQDHENYKKFCLSLEMQG